MNIYTKQKTNNTNNTNMSHKFITDSPGLGLASSILLGPLGLQGWVINPDNSVYGNTGLHQRRLSYALHILVGLLVLFFVITAVWGTKKTSDTNDPKKPKKLTTTGAVFGTGMVLAYVALSISCFISFIIAIILVTKK